MKKFGNNFLMLDNFTKLPNSTPILLTYVTYFKKNSKIILDNLGVYQFTLHVIKKKEKVYL